MSLTQETITRVEQAPFYTDGRNHCEGCCDSPWPGVRADSHPDVAEGVTLVDGETFVERCDICAVYTSDEQAAQAVYNQVELREINGFQLVVASQPRGEQTYYVAITRGPYQDSHRKAYYLHNTAAISPMLESLGPTKGEDPISALFQLFKKRNTQVYPQTIVMQHSTNEDRTVYALTCRY